MAPSRRASSWQTGLPACEDEGEACRVVAEGEDPGQTACDPLDLSASRQKLGKGS